MTEVLAIACVGALFAIFAVLRRNHTHCSAQDEDCSRTRGCSACTEYDQQADNTRESNHAHH